MWGRQAFRSSCSSFVSFPLTWTMLSGLLSHPFHPPSRLDQQLNWRDKCYRGSPSLRLTRRGQREKLREELLQTITIRGPAYLSFLKLSFYVTEHNAYVHFGSSWSLTYDLELNHALFLEYNHRSMAWGKLKEMDQTVCHEHCSGSLVCSVCGWTEWTQNKSTRLSHLS